MSKLLVFALCVWTSVSLAATVERIEFKDEQLVGTQKYVLNGTGLRIKKKLGMKFKVYVAALYLPAKSKDADEIIKGGAPKILELVFLREVDRETLQDAWKEGFAKNCKEDCEAAKGQFKAFHDLMVDVRDGSRLKMTFDRNGVSVDIKGTKTNSAVIDGEPFRRALLAIFIGDHPPSPELKAGLLGI